MFTSEQEKSDYDGAQHSHLVTASALCTDPAASQSKAFRAGGGQRVAEDGDRPDLGKLQDQGTQQLCQKSELPCVGETVSQIYALPVGGGSRMH